MNANVGKFFFDVCRYPAQIILTFESENLELYYHRMTLHEAIEQILFEAKQPLSYSEIADRINDTELYTKSDNSKITANQISARVKKYQGIFSVDVSGVTVQNIDLRPYKDLHGALNKLCINYGLDLETSAILNAVILFSAYNGPRIGFDPDRDFKRNLVDLFREIDHRISEYFQSTSYVMDRLESRLTERISGELYHLLDRFHYNDFIKPSETDFSEFFNIIVNEYTVKDRFRGGAHSTPKIISHLMVSLGGCRDHPIVFDPFAGKSGLIHEFSKLCRPREIIASDINETAGYIGTLNILSAGPSQIRYRIGDSFECWPHQLNADVVISAPPVNLKTNDYHYENWQSIHSDDCAINAIQLALYHVHSHGKLILLIPESFLISRKNDARAMREYLTERNYLRGAILLPKDSLRPLTAINMAVIVIDKSLPEDDEIFLADLSNYSSNDLAIIDEISRSFLKHRDLRGLASWQRRSQIDTYNYEINIRKHLLVEPGGADYIYLGEVVEEVTTGTYVETDNLNPSNGLPYIEVKDLNDTNGIYKLVKENLKTFVSDSELIKGKRKLTTENSILISKIGNKLKPTLVDTQVDGLYSSNIICLKPNENIVPAYLITQLQSDYVKAQVEAIRRYSGIPSFSLYELKNIRIKIIPIEEQHQLVSDIYSQQVLTLEKDTLRSSDDILYNVISRIKHEMNQPISSLGIDLQVLLSYLQKKSADRAPVSMLDLTVSPLEGQMELDTNVTKLSNVLDRMTKCVADTQQTLKKAEETLNIRTDALKLQMVDIKDLLEQDIIPLYGNANCVIILKGGSHPIKADKYQLKLLFKNLFDNALKHGFVESKPRNENIISVQIAKAKGEDMIEILVMNNGRKFPEGFKTSIFETKGITSSRDNGSGFGGYHIRRIIENHKGQFQIVPSDQLLYTNFKVQFKIYLPLSN